MSAILVRISVRQFLGCPDRRTSLHLPIAHLNSEGYFKPKRTTAAEKFKAKLNRVFYGSTNIFAHTSLNFVFPHQFHAEKLSAEYNNSYC